MSENRLPDYLEHMQQAATDACAFVDGMSKARSWKTSALSRPSS
ncbi:hypothetical protein AWB71_00375 [Caballeronia peredens]|nr:hypothetical protein AWB71_00375 [Caballeronia peredens]